MIKDNLNKVEIYNELDHKLYLEWEKAWSGNKNANIFNSPFWYKACTQSESYKELLIIVCRSSFNEIVGVLPLVLARKYGFDLYQSPGGKFLDKSTIFLSSLSVETLSQMINSLKEKGDFYLTEVEDKYKNLIVEQSDIKSYNCSVGRSLDLEENPFRHLSHETVRRLRKRVRDMGKDLRFEFRSGYLKDSITKIKEIESQSNKVEQQKEVFNDDFLYNHCQYIDSLSKNTLFVSLLYYKNEPICYKYGFIVNNTYHYSNTAFKKIYSDMSSGRILMMLTIDKIVEMGLKEVDFSRGDTSFKREFTDHMYHQHTIFYFKNYIFRNIWILMYRIKQVLDRNDTFLEKIRIVVQKIKFII